MFRFLLTALLMGLASKTVDSASVAKPPCGGTTSSKDIQLLPPKNPPRECNYHITAYSSNVCQLRIDFAMTLAQPTIPGRQNNLKYATCVDDFFEVAGLRLCGIETQQHIYVPFNRTAGFTKVDMRVILAARVGWTELPTPDWNIRVTQLECPSGASIRQIDEMEKPESRASIKDGFFVAPAGCLQYFPQAVGTFTSFNFNDGNGIYPGGLNYAICFRRTQFTKSLQLNARFFKLGHPPNQANMGVDNQCYPQFQRQETNADFVMIPQGTVLETGMHATYFCGDSPSSLNIRSTHPGPLMMIFNSDGDFQQSEVGFAFAYSIE